MRKLIVLLLLLLNAFIIKAQSLSGSLIDVSGNPVSFANVVLLNRCDSSFVQGTISDENGNFSIEPFTDENILRISCLGFLPITKVYVKSPITIVMQEDINLLDEVVVKADLPVTRMKGDAMVTSVENSVLSKVGSANDVLTKIPGITKSRMLLKSSVKERLLYILMVENCTIYLNWNNWVPMKSRK